MWLRSTEFGDSRDRVLVKSNGDATYLAGDLAYHRDKFLVREFDRVIDIFGADHHGQVASLRAGVVALGVERDRLEIRLGQLVSIVGRRMSKRSGQLRRARLDHREIGPDADRLLSLINSIDQATTLDLDLVHAPVDGQPGLLRAVRACPDRLDRAEACRARHRARPDRRRLSSPARPGARARADALPRRSAARRRGGGARRAPHKVTSWVRQLAGEFHGFYHDCRVLGDEVPPELPRPGCGWSKGVRIGLAIGLGLLGVKAPDEM